MRLVTLRCLGAICAICPLSHAQLPAAPADTPKTPAADLSRVTTADLAWMAGRWVGQMFGKPAEEHWTRPSAGALVGMYRLGGPGDSPVYELILIEQEADGIVMRLRHFSTAYREIDQEPTVLRLTQAKPNEAVFENPQVDRPRKIVYRRSGETMVIGLEFVGDNGPSYREYELRAEAAGRE